MTPLENHTQAKEAAFRPAFPTPTEDGISVRAYIAAKAMAAMIGSAVDWSGRDQPERIATVAVRYADALIIELQKP